MPEISRFLGIIIRMFFADHATPHFHVDYQTLQASVEIESGIVKGSLPPRVLGLVQEWRALHRDDLLDTWKRGVETGNFGKIAPLE